MWVYLYVIFCWCGGGGLAWYDHLQFYFLCKLRFFISFFRVFRFLLLVFISKRKIALDQISFFLCIDIVVLQLFSYSRITQLSLLFWMTLYQPRVFEIELLLNICIIYLLFQHEDKLWKVKQNCYYLTNCIIANNKS